MLSKKLLRLPLLLLIVSGIFTSTAHAVDTPRELRGTEVRQNTVKWEWERVSGADRYAVTVNGNYLGTTRDDKFYSDDLPAGQHRMFVQSVDGNGQWSAPSQVASIRVSETFKPGSYRRSVLLDEVGGAETTGERKSAGNSSIPQNVRGTERSPRNVRWRWNAVPGANEYEVTVDGIFAGKTNDTYWDSEDLWVGTHSMTVKARNNAGSLSEQSETVKVQVTGSSAGPTGTNTSPGPNSSFGDGVVSGLRAKEYEGRDVKWQWSSFDGAVEYQVTVDGVIVGKTSDREWLSRDLWRGNHSLTVRAVASNGRMTPQSDTLKFEVTGNAGGSAGGGSTADPIVQNDKPSNPAPPPPTDVDRNAAGVENLIDPASYNYSEVSNKSGYKLVFSDEFNGDALNPYRWHSQLRWDGEWNGERYEYRVVNGEDQFYVNVLSPDEEHRKEILPVYNPFKFGGGKLRIQAAINPLKDKEKRRDHGKLMDMARQQEFLSGAISTHEKFAQKYGYFEARIKIPSHVGTFPAFWLFHERRAWEGTQRTEIDIMENLGHAPYYIYNSFHYFKNVTRYYGGDANFIKPKPSGQIFTGVDYSQDFHVYAVEWEPGKITWFIDGEKVSELYNGEADYEELYVMLNLAMGGNWTNFPKNAGGLGRPGNERYPTSQDVRDFSNPALEIDYVRVYKRR